MMTSRLSALMRFLLFSLLALLSACAGSGGVSLPTVAPEIPAGYAMSGEYTGDYSCPQGVTNMDLKVFSNPEDPNEQYAIFSFGPPSTNVTEDPQGSFLLSGRANTRDGISLQPVSWIKQPLFYSMVSMYGNTTDDGA